MSGAWEGGSTRKWRKIRLEVLQRDRYRCQLRIAGICRTRADCVHHLFGKAAGDAKRGLVAACTPCNLHIGDPGRAPSGGKAIIDPPPSPRTAW
jgi:5-methylcytosine-specific restriction endonuclease McrA